MRPGAITVSGTHEPIHAVSSKNGYLTVVVQEACLVDCWALTQRNIRATCLSEAATFDQVTNVQTLFANPSQQRSGRYLSRSFCNYVTGLRSSVNLGGCGSVQSYSSYSGWSYREVKSSYRWEQEDQGKTPLWVNPEGRIERTAITAPQKPTKVQTKWQNKMYLHTRR